MKIKLSQATKEVLYLIKKKNNDVPLDKMILALLKLGMNSYLKDNWKIDKEGNIY